MHDYKKILNNLEEYKIKLGRKKFDLDVEYFVGLINEINETRQESERLQTERNAGSKQVGILMRDKEGNAKEIEKIKAEMLELTEKTKIQENKLRDKEAELRDYMLRMPNIYDDTTPIGNDDSDNLVKAYYGEKPKFDFEPVEHYVIGEKMGIIDTERGAKLSGARFAVLSKAGTLLEMAVKNFLFETAMENGFSPVSVPFLVGRDIAEGTGQLPKFEEDMFKVTEDGKDLFLIPTAEVPVTNLYRHEVLNENDLTISLCSLTPCFRVEVGSAGRDIKGIFRQHQFEKLEMVKFTHPDKSWEELEILTGSARRILDKLGLHYREVSLCTGDLGFGAAHCNDIEVWLPGQNQYREISSCSNYLDFQARRANIKFRNTKTNKNEFVHTLNGSGLPVGRTMIAIIENYQQKDGSILIPEALKKWLPYTRINTNGELE